MKTFNLAEELEKERKKNKKLEEKIDFLIDRNDKKQEVIDKAGQYIKEKYLYLLGDDTFLGHDEKIDRKQIIELLNILSGNY